MSFGENMQMITFIVTSLVVLLTALFFRYYWKTLRKLSKIPQIKGHILLGNLEMFTGKLFDKQTQPLHQRVICTLNSIFKIAKDVDVFLVWITCYPYVLLTSAKSVEEVLSSSKIIEKSRDYEFLKPWLKTGLLTSGSEKWKSRRKFLTPSFHFRILNDFIPIMNKHSRILVHKLKTKVNSDINIVDFVQLEALDVIGETAMGVSLEAQANPESKYTKCVISVADAMFTRFFEVINWIDFIYYRRKAGKEFKKSLQFLHEFTVNVINERKNLMLEASEEQNVDVNANDETMFFGSKKRRIAFMDLLIKRHLDGMKSNGISDFTLEDIREEVDTFMFEGFDTTSAALTWTLHLLGHHPEIQEKAYEELYSIFGEDKEREITDTDLRDMKYIEMCIKETLRLYPSVPIFARSVTEEINVCGYTVPKNSAVFVYTYGLHRDPKVFVEPEKFIPERFLPENCVSRHPFAYVPFSAGPRNCIGQKFAMNELKITVGDILRNFKITSMKKEIDISIDLIIKAREPVIVNLIQRQ